jgi:hypothetical protein
MQRNSQVPFKIVLIVKPTDVLLCHAPSVAPLESSATPSTSASSYLPPTSHPRHPQAINPSADLALSKPQSSDSSQSSLSTKTASQGPSLTLFNLLQYASPFIFIPAYAEVSFPTCSAIYVRHPTTCPGYSEIPTPYDGDGEVIRLAWGWYSKVRPRMRSETQMAREPV